MASAAQKLTLGELFVKGCGRWPGGFRKQCQNIYYQRVY